MDRTLNSERISIEAVTAFSNALGWTELGAFYIQVMDWRRVFMDRKDRDKYHYLTLKIGEGFQDGRYIYFVGVHAMKFGVASGHYPIPLTDSIPANVKLAERCRTLLHRENFESARNAKKYVARFPEVKLMGERLISCGALTELPATKPFPIPNIIEQFLS
jgi:hypothetical protein